MVRTVALFFFFLFVSYIECNLIRNSPDIETKDVPIPREDFENNDLKAAPEEIATDVLSLEVEPSIREPVKTCVKIGQFCTSHSDCCTRTCMGYMKKCVTGSGLYPDYIDPTTA